MRKKQQCIYLKVNVDGKTEEVLVLADELRQCLKDAKIKNGVEEVGLKLDQGDRVLRITMKVSDIRRLLKQAFLSSKFIPNALTPYLIDVTQNLSQKPIMPISGRENELEKVWFYLSQKTRNNVFLIGDTDVGKTAIANEIARQISTNECPKEFYEKRVIMLRPEVLFKIKNDYLFEATVKSIMNFVVKNKKKLILYVDRAIYMKTYILLITMLYATIKKYNIPIIFTASEEDYEQYFLEDTSIAKYLNDVYVQEPELNEVEPMIRNHILLFENRYKVKISEEIIQYGIYTSRLSNSVSSNPGNVISIFEKAFLEARRKGKKYVDKKCILSCYGTRIKEYQKMPMEEKRATAYHETGHYIAIIKAKNRTDAKISCVSILPMNWWAGVTMWYFDLESMSVRSKEYYIDMIAELLAGRVAEKIHKSKLYRC